jgi:hypothetical protein
MMAVKGRNGNNDETTATATTTTNANANNLELYLLQKAKCQPPNSLNFESEMFQASRPSNLIATEPYKRSHIHPWKYSYKTLDYQNKCTDSFRRVRTACIDLSKY